MPNLITKFYALVKKHWFLLGLLFAILLAAIYPPLGKKNGHIRAEISISIVGVGLIFLLSGLSLKTKALVDAFTFWKLILVVQIFSLGFIPAFGYAMVQLVLLLPINYDIRLAQGIIICFSCPTTISSNVLMTKQAGGNEAAALTNAVLGSILGVFITPALIIWLLGLASVEGGINYLSIFGNLGITVIGPMILGQIIRNAFPKFVPWLQKFINLSIVNSSLLLLLVYSVFCDTFSAAVFLSIDASQLIGTIFFCILAFALFFGISLLFWYAKWFQFTRKDMVAVVMCGTTKTAALGIPLINVMFLGNPNAGILSIPLLAYHAIQLIFCASLVGKFQEWIAYDLEETELARANETSLSVLVQMDEARQNELENRSN
jgi:solute carrier family 10 (sodium/bile acid cotransporter), member 7